MNPTIAANIEIVLGLDALTYIRNSFEVIELPDFTIIRFWLLGHECEYYPDTDPILLRQVETDKEFVTFEQLLEEIHEPIHSPTV